MKEIILMLLDYSKLNAKQFSEKLGMKRGQAIYDVMSGKTKRISDKLANQIISEFPEISRTWLLTGEGEMLKNQSANSDSHSISIAGEEIKENNISVNTDDTIARLLAEVAAQRKVTEKVIDQNSKILEQNSELLALVAGKVIKTEGA